MDWYIYLAVIAAGFVCGFINTVAGSGSMITLPLLIFLGLPANVANGTNRVAIILQNLVGTGSFHKQKVLDWRGGIILAIPAVLGSIIGAQIAVNIDEQLMRRVIGGLMLVMLVIVALRPGRWLQGRSETAGKSHNWLQMLTFFGIGIYGGFIQAGVGIFLLAGLVLGAGYDLIRANAIKMMIILLFTVAAIAIFVHNDQVRWGVGLILSVGSMLGAYVASRMAVKRGAGFVSWLLIAVLVLSAILLLDIPELVARLF